MGRKRVRERSGASAATIAGRRQGTQPPPPGPYAFLDGFHEIHEIGYETPESRVAVGDSGSASVTLTTIGTLGGFLEGTFSATVFEKGVLAAHYITGGEFRVKYIEVPRGVHRSFAAAAHMSKPGSEGGS
jgi:hypothetical protein